MPSVSFFAQGERACYGCDEDIPKKAMRNICMGNGQGGHWHPACFFPARPNFGGPSRFRGFAALEGKDQRKLERLFEAAPVAIQKAKDAKRAAKAAATAARQGAAKAALKQARAAAALARKAATALRVAARLAEKKALKASKAGK